MTDPATIDRGDGTALAYRFRAGRGPTAVFLPGYRSDMGGTKAEALDAWAAARGRAFLRLDYSSCGASGGRFADGTISRWTDDVLAVIDAVTAEPVVLVGSSMGGWIALRLALARPAQVAALVGIAAAPDFTDWSLSDAERATAARDGCVARPNAYGPDPYVYTHGLIADGAACRVLPGPAAACRVLPGPVAIDCPVRLLHGQADPDVPWRLSLDLAAALRSRDVQVTLIKDGDHRLSRPADLALLTATLDGLPAAGDSLSAAGDLLEA